MPRSHGVWSSHKRLYDIWTGMMARCTRPEQAGYVRYGARGIQVCTDWHDVVAFRDWAIAAGYQDDLTIDRLDNTGNYEPENCRWVSWKEQALNRCSNHVITFQGESLCMSEWAGRLGVKRGIVYYRLKRGWPIARALTEAPKPKPRRAVLSQP